MNGFQSIAIAALCLLLGSDIAQLLRGRGRKRVRLVRIATWLAAGTAIADPNLTTIVARSIGIQRGADLVSYLASLGFLAFAFYGYACYLRLESQTTALARRLAILTAECSEQEKSDGLPSNAEVRR